MSDAENPTFDLVVIGSGPGGYVGAVRAAQHGLRVAIIEKDRKLGGTCLHRGCIPTKALLESASIYDHVKHSKTWGITTEGVGIDWKLVQKRKDKVVAKNAAGIDFLMKKNKITPFQGHGRVAGAGKVTVTAEDGTVTELGAKKIMLAMGSVPRAIPGFEFDGERVLSSDHLIPIDHLPDSLIVLGAGAVGTEFASVFGRMGAKTTLVEFMPRILPIEDEECSAELERALRKQRIDVRTSTKAVSVERLADKVRVELGPASGEGATETLEAELLLVAVGRAPVIGDCGLESIGLAPNDHGVIEVDAHMRTSVPDVYAIGDIVPGPMLAHLASAEGILAADHAAGAEIEPINYDLVPSATYCEPEVASVGLTEAIAKERGYRVRTGKFPFSAIGKARIMDSEAGFVKIVEDERYGEILGVHIVGPRATDLLAEACVAMKLESTSEELARVIHAHPTLSEAVMEAAHAVTGKAIHM